MAERDGVDEIVGQWAAERPDLDASPMLVVGRVSRLSRELERRLAPVFEKHGLEGGLFDVLAAIRRSGAPYRVRPSELAESLMLTTSGTTKRLDRLERSGLIARHRDGGDRRALLIELTPAGRKLVDTVVAEHVANEDHLLESLTGPERRQLAGLMRKLLNGLPPAER